MRTTSQTRSTSDRPSMRHRQTTLAQPHPDLRPLRHLGEGRSARPARIYEPCAHRGRLWAVSADATTRNDEQRCRPTSSIATGQHRVHRLDLSFAWSPRRSCQSEGLCPRRAGRSPGWPATRTAAAGLGEGCGIPSTSPKGYHTAARGQSKTTYAPVSVERCPRAAVWSGSARSTGCHTSSRVQDRRWPSRARHNQLRAACCSRAISCGKPRGLCKTPW
jgi:hypothetical protein